MVLQILKYCRTVGIPIVGLLAFFLIDPFELGYLACYLLTVLIYIKKDFILKHLDTDFLVLAIFSITYALFSILDPDIYVQTIFFYGIFPPVFFLLGKYFVFKAEDLKTIYIVFLLVGFLYSFTALLSVLTALRGGGFTDFERKLPMFWNGRLRSATLMGAYFTFNMCIPALLLVRKQVIPFIFRILSIVIFVLSLLCVFRLGSRTQVVICALTVGITLILMVPKQTVQQNMRLFFLLIIVAGLIYLYVPMDLDSQYLSTLGRRLQESNNTGSAGGRTERWVKSIENLFQKPFGWDFKEFGYSHNLWLDVAQVNGLIPFFALLLFSMRTLINTKCAYILNKKELSLNSIIIAFTIAANLLFFVEPVTEGVFSIFLVYCFFQGGISKYVANLKAIQKNKSENVILRKRSYEIK